MVNVKSGSAEPCAYCAKYAAGHCIGLGAFPDLETQQQQRRLELEAQHRSAGTLPPPAPPATSGSNRLLQAFDEGDMPYYYYKDTSYNLACKYELLDTSVANPEWARDPPADVAVTEGKPPERSEYDLGEHGQKAYHRHRARWYREHTCKELTGSLEEQNEQWDNYKRDFRADAARGDRAPLERRHVIEPLWDDSE